MPTTRSNNIKCAYFPHSFTRTLPLYTNTPHHIATKQVTPGITKAHPPPFHMPPATCPNDVTLSSPAASTNVDQSTTRLQDTAQHIHTCNFTEAHHKSTPSSQPCQPRNNTQGHHSCLNVTAHTNTHDVTIAPHQFTTSSHILTTAS